MRQDDLRIGIVGAGQITRSRHLPAFAMLPGVRVVGVCNRHRESSSRVARDFDIPKIYGGWEDLVSDKNIDAVVIGTWPYMHCSVTLAALDAGKHVLTQARMAMNAREAQRMFDRSRECPNLTAMVVPSPYGLTGERFIQSLMAEGFLGRLHEVHGHWLTSDLADPELPLGWRQQTRFSGFNMLTLGILYETVIRWVPPARYVMASASKKITHRRDPETNRLTRVGVPDSVQVLTTHDDKISGVFRLSGLTWHERSMAVALYGSEGTLIYDLFRDQIHGGRRNDKSLREMPIPEVQKGGWQVESDFIASIRGDRPVIRTDFATGVLYMQFTEAVARSSRHQSQVSLPLQEFSNPSL